MSISKALWGGLIAALFLIANPAFADPLPGTTRVLGPDYPISIEQYTQGGLVEAASSVESQSPGTISFSYCYQGSPSCVSGLSDVELGSDPSLSAFVHTSCDEGYPCSHPDDYSLVSSGSSAILDYEVELVDSNPNDTGPQKVNFNANDIINLTGDSGAAYYFTITGITNALSIQDCEGQISCYENVPIAPISSITSVMLVPNNVYYVSMHLVTEAYGHTGDSAYALLDPTFSVPDGSDGTLVYSAGLISDVPEPGMWMLMLIGFGMIGAALRSRRTVGLQARRLGL